MQVSVDEIGVTRIRETKFFLGSQLSKDSSLIYFAPLDEKRGPKQRWIVIDQGCWDDKDGYVKVYTTEEMQILYRSVKGIGDKPVSTADDIGYRFLVSSGRLRMKIREGCAGCRRFWGGDSEGECRKCHRCYACCGKEKVPFSCASNHASDGKKRR